LQEKLPEIITRLLHFEPIQYIFGHTEWMGLDLKVTPATLIPRPETAELVTLICNPQTLNPSNTQTLKHSNTQTLKHSTLNILDLGTGSGCIALALKQRHPEWQVAGLDNSREALSIARNNAARNNLDVHFFYADILTDDIGHYDLIVSNPPYIRPSERDSMTANTLLHEPAQALFVPENDPLIFYRRIAELHAADELWFEINEHLGNEMITRMQQSGYEAQCLTDSYGKQRFIHAQFSR
jgi:release factor glutamine methyltransferase